MNTFKDIDVFDKTYNFYKGNLHSHSTASDGKLTRAELTEGYRNKGYSFICYSDHRIFADYTGFDTEDFISLPGVEYNCDHVVDGKWLKTHHIHGVLGTKQMVKAAKKSFVHGELMPKFSAFDNAATVVEMRDYLMDRGCFCIYNHPVWSCTSPSDFGLLEGFCAMEVYNHGCHLENKTGQAETYLDNLLSGGSQIFAVATDDNHNGSWPDDSYGGWICVNAHKLNHEDIVQNILDGRFYSSTGPEILNYGVRKGQVYVECSPCHHINFVARGEVCAGAVTWSRTDEDNITSAAYKITGKEQFIRIECVTKDGKIAWSNAIHATDRA